MQYTFQVLTTEGIKETLVESVFDFSNAPFGYVPYRFSSSSECSQYTLDEFWNCIDIVLQNNNLTNEDYIRAICAFDHTGKYYGESLNIITNSEQNNIVTGNGPPEQWIHKWD